MGVRARLFVLNVLLLYVVFNKVSLLSYAVSRLALYVCVIGSSYWLTKFLYKFFYVRESMSLHKAVLITGCDTGFGHDLARRLAARGFQVYAGCLSPATARGLQSHSNLTLLKMDVTNKEDITNCYNEVQKSLGENRLWAVVANAGISKTTEFEWEPVECIERVFDVNVFGVVRVIKEFLPLLRRGHGRVVITASAASHITGPGLISYSMTKHAVRSLADGLRVELAKWGIDVCTIEPFIYKTPMANAERIEKDLDDIVKVLPEDVRKDYGEDYIAGYKNLIRKHLRFGTNSNPREVVDNMIRAVTESEPQAYYPTGGCTDIAFYYLWKVLPHEFADFVIGKVTDIGAEISTLS